MSVTFIASLTHHFDDVFVLQPSGDIRGGGSKSIQINQKRDGSLFGILGELFKRDIPFLRSIILPEVGNFIKEYIYHDISQKFPSRESLKSNLLSSARNIGSRTVRGGGKHKTKPKQKRKSIEKDITVKKTHCVIEYKDVFNSGD